MNVSHVIYKVNDLDAALAKWRSNGYHVEYGSKTNPHNAIVYFSEGPYVELLNQVNIPIHKKLFLRLIGKGGVVDRMETWNKRQEGFIEVCLENQKDNFDHEIQILKKYGQPYFVTTSERLDPKGRLLAWNLLFPLELRLPFLMTYFTIDPKPKSFIHPNGIKRIESVSLGVREALVPLIQELCEDDTLQISVGDGVSAVAFGS